MKTHPITIRVKGNKKPFHATSRTAANRFIKRQWNRNVEALREAGKGKGLKIASCVSKVPESYRKQFEVISKHS